MTNILDSVEPDALLESNGHPKHKSSIQSATEFRLWGKRQPLYSRETVEALLAECRKEVALANNRAELLAEDIEALHMCLDRERVPRTEEGETLSLWGRVLRYRKQVLMEAAAKAESMSVQMLTAVELRRMAEGEQG